MQHTQARAWPRSNAQNKTLTNVLSLRCFNGSLVRLSLYVCEYLSTRRVVCEYLSHNLFDRKRPEGRGNGWVRVRIFLVQLLCCVGLWVGRFRLIFVHGHGFGSFSLGVWCADWGSVFVDFDYVLAFSKLLKVICFGICAWSWVLQFLALGVMRRLGLGFRRLRLCACV